MKSLILLFSMITLALPVVAQQNASKRASMVCPPIVYPKQSRRLEEEGTVQLLIKVNDDATVGEITIEKSSGYNRLDLAAVELVQNCQFVAAIRESIPYNSNLRQRFTFRLEGGIPKQ